MAVPKQWQSTLIESVLTRSVTFSSDGRGAFGELWRNSWTAGLDLRFTQANLSISRSGVLRGLHFHERQTDLWVVLEGRAFVALVDLRLATVRDGTPSTRVESMTVELQAGGSLLIPPGVAHGFLAVDPVRLLYMVTNEYDGTDEHGFAWNDPLVALNWPTDAPTLSTRDATAQSLADVLRTLGER